MSPKIRFKPDHLDRLSVIYNPSSSVLCQWSFDLHLQLRPQSATSATYSHLSREPATSATSHLLPLEQTPSATTRHLP